MPQIPILKEKQKICHKYVKALEEAITADGCTGVTEAYHDCCIIHDLGYRYHIDPWGRTIDKAQTDSNFKTCMQSKSWIRWFSPMSWWRYAGVKWFGGKFYTTEVKPFSTFYWR